MGIGDEDGKIFFGKLSCKIGAFFGQISYACKILSFFLFFSYIIFGQKNLAPMIKNTSSIPHNSRPTTIKTFKLVTSFNWQIITVASTY